MEFTLPKENQNLLAADQRTDEWFKERSGKFTGSRFTDLLAIDAQGKPLKARQSLVMQVIGERLTGQYQEKGMDAYSLKHGREIEPFATEQYEMQTGIFVHRSGFITHKDISFVGVSPDGLVGDKGGLEIKCPSNWDIHLARWEYGMEDMHLPQVQGCMWVTGREWWDFVSYDPRVKEHLQFYRQRIWRDEAYIANLKREAFLAEAEVRERLKFYNIENINQISLDRVKEIK